MILSDAGLEVTRDQPRRADCILELTKQEVGRNPVQYQLFSQGIIDMIESLRAEIDAYTRVIHARPPASLPQEQSATPEPARS